MSDDETTHLRRLLTDAQAEIERLKRGDFTADEIHAMCHKLEALVPAGEFARGCADFQVKLYGRAPTRDALERLKNTISELLTLVHQPNPTDPAKWCVRKGSGKAFSALIARLVDGQG